MLVLEISSRTSFFHWPINVILRIFPACCHPPINMFEVAKLGGNNLNNFARRTMRTIRRIRPARAPARDARPRAADLAARDGRLAVLAHARVALQVGRQLGHELGVCIGSEPRSVTNIRWRFIDFNARISDTKSFCVVACSPNHFFAKGDF